MAQTLAQLDVLLTLNTRKFNSTLSRVQRRIRAQARELESVGNQIMNSFVVPLGLAGGAAVKLAYDFDVALTKTISLVGRSRESIEAMNDELLKMAGDTGRAPAELAESLFFVSSGGIEAADALEVVEATAKAAAIGMGEAKQLANATVSAMNAYAKSGLTAEQALDTLVATVRLGIIETDELAPAIGRLLPLSSELGIEFNEVGAALAAMTRVGYTGAEATTALRTVMLALIKPTDQGAKQLSKMGLSLSILRERVAEGGLLPALQSLREQLKGNIDTTAQVFTRIRALGGVLALTGDNANSVEQIFAEMSDTTNELNDAFSETEKSGAHQLRKAFNELLAIITKVGQDIIPAIIPPLKIIAAMTQTLAGALNAIPGPVKTIIVSLGALTAAYGALAFIKGKLLRLYSGYLGVLGNFNGVLREQWSSWQKVEGSVGKFKTTSARAVKEVGLLGKSMKFLGGMAAVASTALTAWNFGRWVSDVTGITDAVSGAGSKLKEFSELLVEDQDQYARTLVYYNKMVAALGEQGEQYKLCGESIEENAFLMARYIDEVVVAFNKQQQLAQAEAAARNKHISQAEALEMVSDAMKATAERAGVLGDELGLVDPGERADEFERLGFSILSLKNAGRPLADLKDKFLKPMAEAIKQARVAGEKVPGVFRQALNAMAPMSESLKTAWEHAKKFNGFITAKDVIESLRAAQADLTLLGIKFKETGGVAASSLKDTRQRILDGRDKLKEMGLDVGKVGAGFWNVLSAAEHSNEALLEQAKTMGIIATDTDDMKLANEALTESSFAKQMKDDTERVNEEIAKMRIQLEQMQSGYTIPVGIDVEKFWADFRKLQDQAGTDTGGLTL